MPSWKKVIISGSDAALNSLDVGTITVNDSVNPYTLPTADGSNGQVLQTNGTGTVTFETPTVDEITNNTNNYILTATGTSAINGESNLQFDGTDLDITGGGGLKTNGGSVNTGGGNVDCPGGNVNIGGGSLNGTPGSGVNVDTVTATVKNFVIDHPSPEKQGYKLRHSSLEGPEIGVYFRGKSTENIIDLPDYWVDLVDKDSITVSLTSFGSPCQHYIEDIRDNQVIVGCACGTPNYHFTVYGERKDVEKLVVEYKEEKYL